MPDALTHVFMSEDTLNKLPFTIKNNLDLGMYHLGSQGPDVFFYHHMMPWKKKSTFPAFGSQMHGMKTREFFLQMIDYIKTNRLTTNKYLISYLYGFICHYTLDYTTHPYLFYFSGDYDVNNELTYKYRGRHLMIERWIDAYMIFERTNNDPNRFVSYKYFLNHSVQPVIKEMLNHSIEKVYGMKDLGERYVEAHREMYLSFRYLFLDRYGIKKQIYRFYDTYFNKKGSIVYETMSYYINLNTSKNYLNEEKKEYNHPMVLTEKYNDSFFELYNKAIKDAQYKIQKVHEYLENKVDSIEDLFLNLNYSTGKDCDISLEMKYFID